MTIYHVVDIFTGVMESIMIFMLYETFLAKKANIHKGAYIAGVIVLSFIINTCNLFYNLNTLNVIIISVCFFAMSFLYAGKLSVKIIISVFGFLLMSISEVLVLFIMTLVYGATVPEIINNDVYGAVGMIVSKMLAFFFVKNIKLRSKKDSLHIDNSYWLLFLIMFISSTATIFLIFKISYDAKIDYMYNASVFCSIGLLLSTFFALHLYEHLAKQNAIIRTQQQYEQNLKMQLKHLDEILITQNQIKKFKHDFTNYTIGLQSFIDEGDIAGAKTYIKDLKDSFNPDGSVIETGNTALDAIISTKKAIAESKNIEFDTKIQIPKQMMIDPIDICVIFGNALDNSIEACERIEDGEKKISVTVMCQDKAVFCRIINTAPAKQEIEFKTSKQDKSNHGFGLENIKMALAKYNSEPTIIQSDTEFILKFVIFLK